MFIPQNEIRDSIFIFRVCGQMVKLGQCGFRGNTGILTKITHSQPPKIIFESHILFRGINIYISRRLQKELDP